jgi:hypothetical protein
MKNPYIVGALVERGVNKAVAQKLVKYSVIENPINVDTLSCEDINKLIELLHWLEERGELEIVR